MITTYSSRPYDDFPDGFPSGRVGFYSNVASVTFSNSHGSDVSGSLRNNPWPQSPAWGDMSGGGFKDGSLDPGFHLLKGVRTPDGTSGNAGFQVTFSGQISTSNSRIDFLLNVTAQDDYDYIRLHDGYTDCYQVEQGGPREKKGSGVVLTPGVAVAEHKRPHSEQP